MSQSRANGEFTLIKVIFGRVSCHWWRIWLMICLWIGSHSGYTRFYLPPLTLLHILFFSTFGTRTHTPMSLTGRATTWGHPSPLNLHKGLAWFFINSFLFFLIYFYCYFVQNKGCICYVFDIQCVDKWSFILFYFFQMVKPSVIEMWFTKSLLGSFQMQKLRCFPDKTECCTFSGKKKRISYLKSMWRGIIGIPNNSPP